MRAGVEACVVVCTAYRQTVRAGGKRIRCAIDGQCLDEATIRSEAAADRR